MSMSRIIDCCNCGGDRNDDVRSGLPANSFARDHISHIGMLIVAVVFTVVAAVLAMIVGTMLVAAAMGAAVPATLASALMTTGAEVEG